MEYFLAAWFFALLGAAYVKGYDVVKSRSPESLVQFYLIMAALRMLLTATMVALYVFFAESRDDAITFAGVSMLMYLTMMVVTLSMRH